MIEEQVFAERFVQRLGEVFTGNDEGVADFSRPYFSVCDEDARYHAKAGVGDVEVLSFDIECTADVRSQARFNQILKFAAHFGDRAGNDEIDLFFVHPRPCNRFLGGFHGEFKRPLALEDLMMRFDFGQPLEIDASGQGAKRNDVLAFDEIWWKVACKT